MILQIGIICCFVIPICITILVIIIKKFYRIPDIEGIRKILYDSEVDSIFISTKFQHCTLVEIHKLAKRQVPKNIDQPITEVIEVKSKLVGRFYSIDHEDGTIYSQEGQNIKAGDMVGYIFALHLKNEVYVENDGVIKKILISEGEAVEFGQTIMQIAIEIE